MSAFDEATIRRGNGLGSMASRAFKHAARLQVESMPGEGTRVTLVVKIV